MKNISIYILAAFMVFCISCQEEEKAPLTADGTIPNMVTEVTSESLPGGAKITYKLPEDKDFMMVEAIYKRNGEEATSKSSVFKNYVIIEGLRSQEPLEVNLVSVDRSNNRSKGVSVTVTPGEAPVDKLFKTFTMAGDFGGPRVGFDNEHNIRAEILLYSYNDQGRATYSQSIFIDDNSQMSNVFRGFEEGVKTFGMVAQDRWNNNTDTLVEQVTVLKEVLLDKSKFRQLTQFTNDGEVAWGGTIPGLWDGTNHTVTGGGRGYHTSSDGITAVIPPYTEGNVFISFDMGQLAKLSRVKFWLRGSQGTDNCCNTPYGHGDPRYFEIWGTDKLPENDPKGESLEGWTKLIENGEVIKPSGLSVGQHSNEDLAKAARGEDHGFNIDLPPVRYIRFVGIENWSGDKFLHMTEMEFYGEVRE